MVAVLLMWRHWRKYVPRISADAYGGVPVAVIAAIVFSVALLLGNAGLLVINSVRTLDAHAQYARSYEIKRALTSFQSAVAVLEAAQRGYVLADQPSDRESFHRATRAWHSELDRLRLLTAQQPSLQREIEKLTAMTSEAVRRLEASGIARSSGSPLPDAFAARPDVSALHSRLQHLLESEQARIDALRAAVSRQIWMTVGVAVLATIVTVGVLLGLQRLLRRYVAARTAAETALRRVNEQLNREVEDRTSELTDLSRHLIRVSEEEKSQLARELHDTLGSNLTAISMDLNWVMKRLPELREDLRERLHRALRMLTETVELKHQVIEGLRPSHLDNLGLTFAMRTHCKEFSRLTGMPCAMEVLEDFDELDPGLSIVLYRVVQEALTNVMKHAHAQHVRVSLQREPLGLRLRVQDDGVGFVEGNAKRTSHGLIGMRERVRQVGGSFAVTAVKGGGTMVEVLIPVSGETTVKEMYLQSVGEN